MESLPHLQGIAAATYQRIVIELGSRGITDVISLEEVFPMLAADSLRANAQLAEASTPPPNSSAPRGGCYATYPPSLICPARWNGRTLCRECRGARFHTARGTRHWSRFMPSW